MPQRNLVKCIRENSSFYLFIAPFFIPFIIFWIWPLAHSFYLSLTNWSGFGDPKFIGAEFDYEEIYSPIDLKLGKCSMVLAKIKNQKFDSNASIIKVASKYPIATQNFFEDKGKQVECIKLNGSIEIAPQLGISEMIVDLVSTGKTLKENNLVDPFVDQYNTPTLVDDLAKCLLQIFEKNISGLFHATGKSCINRYELALILADIFHLDKKFIKPVTSKEKNQDAPRPTSTCLDSSKLEKLTDFNFSDFFLL